MTSHLDAIDETDLATLRQVRDLYAHADPEPSELRDRIKFALTVQALHAEVAELMDSSLLATRGTAGVVPTPTDSVTFTAAAVSLMVTANESDTEGRVRVDGWVTVPGSAVEAVASEGARHAISDANGRFVMDDLPHGPIHFVIRTAPDDEAVRPVITPTIQI